MAWLGKLGSGNRSGRYEEDSCEEFGPMGRVLGPAGPENPQIWTILGSHTCKNV